MKGFIFTHPPDYEMSYIAYDTLKKAGVEDIVLCYDKNHAKPKAAYASITTDFPRAGNLNGPKFVEGMLDMFAKESAGHDEIIKVDSDTLVFDLEWTKRPETLVGFQYYPHRAFYGMAYTLKTKAIPLIKDILYGSNYRLTYPEDLMMAELCQDLGVYAKDFDMDTPGGYCGWNWVTRHTVEEHRKRFSVINVYRPEGFSHENARKLVLAKMKQLVAAQ